MAIGKDNSFSKIKSTYAVNLAESKNEATIDIFGVIGVWWDGVESRQFIEEIKALDVDTLTINISSPGGFVDDGLMIYDAINSHKAYVTANLSGVVASAASWIACAADNVVGSDTLLYMIHNVQGGAFGTKDDMRKAADVSEKMESVIVNLYRKKSGQSRAQIQKWMDAETWFTVDEAIDAGFVDKKGKGFSFSYEASTESPDIREFMTNSLNCANLPALTAKQEQVPSDITNNSQNDISKMSEFTKEDRNLLDRIFGLNKVTDASKVSESNELTAALTDQIADLTARLEAANKANDAQNFTSLINGIAEALQPRIQEAANEAVQAVKAELEEVAAKVEDVEQKVESTEAIEAVNARIDELAKGVNTVKAVKAQPETPGRNGEELEKVVAPTNVGPFEAFVAAKKK